MLAASASFEGALASKRLLACSLLKAGALPDVLVEEALVEVGADRVVDEAAGRLAKGEYGGRVRISAKGQYTAGECELST